MLIFIASWFTDIGAGILLSPHFHSEMSNEMTWHLQALQALFSSRCVTGTKGDVFPHFAATVPCHRIEHLQHMAKAYNYQVMQCVHC